MIKPLFKFLGLSGKHLQEMLTSERGTGITEFSLVVPIFIFVVFSTFEAGQMLYLYTSLSDIAQNSTTLASGMQNVAPGIVYSGPGCTQSSTIASSEHLLIHKNILNTLKELNIDYNPVELCIKTEVSNVTQSVNLGLSNSINTFKDIEISISTKYKAAIFPDINNPISTSARAPYLM